MTFDKFNIEYASNCKKKDYLFVGSLAKYTSVSRNIIQKSEKQQSKYKSVRWFRKPNLHAGLALWKFYSEEFQANLEEEDYDGQVPFE